MHYEYTTKNIDYNNLSNLYKIAQMGEKLPQNLKIAFENSMYKCFLYNDTKLIGAGRVLADGVDAAYICDIAIDPSYQGKGYGKEIVNKLVKLSKNHNKIILYANVGKENFYKKLGFSKMNTAMAIFRDSDKAKGNGLIE
jgi:ribosomal protein S18 acetylase RimI-like enzyme